MSVVYDRFGVQVHHGDCLDVLRAMPDASVHSVVTDPPAGISFMGREWDRDRGGRDRWVAWLSERMVEALRVLKPGGHALVWALPRTSHWTALALEDAGFDIRECITHLFGQGFAKSRDVSKDLDRMAGAVRETIGSKAGLPGYSLAPSNGDHRTYNRGLGNTSDPVAECAITTPVTVEARQWAGWGTAVKPAAEMWWLARKPLSSTVAGTVLEHGTGALNIDATRVSISQTARNVETQGRWPSNVVLSHATLLDSDSGEVVGDACADGCVPGICAVLDLNQQSGERPGCKSSSNAVGPKSIFRPDQGEYQRQGPIYPDTGGASRFFPVFRWSPKAPAAERPRVNGHAHPTVKSVDLMRWLVRLITPPGGVVLDMFAGSGTTGQAARAEGMRSILVEADPESIPMIVARLDALPKTDLPKTDAAGNGGGPSGDMGVVDLFSLLDGAS